MTTNVLRRISLCAIIFGLGPSIAMAQSLSLTYINVPPVPPNIEVPAGHSVFLKGEAAGTQNYICLPTPDGPAWKFLAPQATLYQRYWGDFFQQIATHFLAANPSEAGTARPSWQHSFDSSQVWGRGIASSTDPLFVEAGAIPWLLVEVVGAQRGPSGGSLLTKTTFIQRLNTSGGAAPATACTVGALAMVPYTTDYYFYRSSK